jgi:hypothetical protein
MPVEKGWILDGKGDEEHEPGEAFYFLALRDVERDGGFHSTGFHSSVNDE